MRGRDHPLEPRIVEHYEQTDEVDRLTTDEGALELARTKAVIASAIGQPPASILDVGGGPGVYAAWLARNGYDITLIDAIERHVEQATAAATAQPDHPFRAVLGDARALDADDGSTDIVLMLGPLYHLTSAEDRRLALREAARVLRPGGRLVAAGISRFASLLAGAVNRWLVTDPMFRAIVERDLLDGQHRSSDDRYFTTAYFHRPEELRDEVSAGGFRDVRLVAVEGPFWMLPALDRWRADADEWKLLLDYLAHVESEPSMLGVSSHILAIGTRS